MIDLTPIAEPIQKRLFEKTQVLGRVEFPGETVKNGTFTHSKLAVRSPFIRMASGLEKPVILMGGELDSKTKLIKGGYDEIYGSVSGYENKFKRPMPGLKSIEVAFMGGVRALREATVSWTCWSFDDIDRLMPHFLAHGKTVLLEWGWVYDKDSLLKADLQQDNLGYDGIVHGGERIYIGKNLIGRIQFNTYIKDLDLYEATAYLPIELYGSKLELNVAIHQSFAKAKIVDFDPKEMIGISNSRWPLKKIIENGYGVATFYYGDIDPDYDDGFQNGIHPLFYKKNQNYPLSHEWGSLSAWASGLIYCMDYFNQDKDIDEKKVAVFGLSRLGKAALWASALDERFALTISGNSGNGGATIWRRKIGETLYSMNKRIPHWLCKNSNNFNHMEEKLPFDQHTLLSLIGPRPILVASAATDPLSDPIGEFIGAKHASKVYNFLNVEGLGSIELPKDDKLINTRIGYYIRRGKHDITEIDWDNFILFANKYL